MLVEMQPGAPEPGVEEGVEGFFGIGEGDANVLPIHVLPPAGSCSGITGKWQPGDGPQAVFGLAAETGVHGLDAGAAITMRGPGGERRLNGWGAESYSARLTRKANDGSRTLATFLTPGEYTVASSGGSDVGAFEVRLRVGSTLRWTNRDGLATVDRAAGVAVEWNGADPDWPVLVAAMSVDRVSTASYVTLCMVPAGATQFRIPADALANLPASRIEAGLPLSFLVVMQSAAGAQAAIRARGLDEGMAFFIAGSGRSVVYR
jgi:hypothetical protein